jgi:hypothetical protein
MAPRRPNLPSSPQKTVYPKIDSEEVKQQVERQRKASLQRGSYSGTLGESSRGYNLITGLSPYMPTKSTFLGGG